MKAINNMSITHSVYVKIMIHVMSAVNVMMTRNIMGTNNFNDVLNKVNTKYVINRMNTITQIG